MNDGGPSRTALSVALMRAVHTRRDRPRLLDDPWGDRLVSEEEQAALHRRILDGVSPESRARLEALGSRHAVFDAVLPRHPTYGTVVLRSRYAEDALAAAVARGARQYVLIGAGFDSFALRQPDFAHDLQIFEIDHPASQAMKRDRLAACGATIAPNVRFVAADLGTESLADALGRSGFSRTVPAFFSWLGVTIYLTRDANRATLRDVATASAIGSEIVFTYTDQRAIDGEDPTMRAMRNRRDAEGEPWISGFDPTALAGELQALGLALIEDLSGPNLLERYCAGRPDGLTIGPASHVALARVTGASL